MASKKRVTLVAAHVVRQNLLPLAMLLEPSGHHIRETVISEIAAVDNPGSAIIQLLAGDPFQRPSVGLAFLVDGDRSVLSSFRFVQPELENVAQTLLHLTGR